MYGSGVRTGTIIIAAAHSTTLGVRVMRVNLIAFSVVAALRVTRSNAVCRSGAEAILSSTTNILACVLPYRSSLKFEKFVWTNFAELDNRFYQLGEDIKIYRTYIKNL